MAMTQNGLLTEINEGDATDIVVLVNFETPLYIKGYHEYQKIWIPFLQEELCGEIEPANPVENYVVAAKKKKCCSGAFTTGVQW